MKLKKFNENFQNNNPFKEYLVILTDEFYDLSITYPTFSYKNYNKELKIQLPDISDSKYDFLGLKISNIDKNISKEFFVKKVREMNSHLETEDIIFEGFYIMSFNSLLEIDPLNKPSLMKDYVYLLYKTNLNLCTNCIFRCTEDVGYSNYTIDNTYNHCLKNVWSPTSSEEVSYDEKGIDCQYHKRNINDKVIIHIDVEDDLKDHLYGNMDIDLAEAFKKYNNFEGHSWD